jgi:hypothetical protein
MADFNDVRIGRTGPRTMPRPNGTPRPGTPRPGTSRLGTPRPGTSRKGTPRPGTSRLGTPRPGTGRPGEPDGGDEGVGRAEHWIQFTERLKHGYSSARYGAWNSFKYGQRNVLDASWTSVGPSDNVGARNIGGRITCLASVPLSDSPERLLAGAACGGLWHNKVNDSGATLEAWAPIGPPQ